MKGLATIALIFLVCLGQAQAGCDKDSLELQGMFSSTENAAQFQDCRTGLTFPVFKTGPYAELEQAYLASGTEPGKGLMVAIRGRYLEGPAGDGSTNELVMLVVDSFKEVIDSGGCAPAESAPLRDTYWKLLEIDGKSITTPQDQKDAHLLLAGDNSTVQGFSGCNRFFGQYSSTGEVLTFSGMGSTRMACAEGMDTEAAFLQALGETNRAVINGAYLQLYAEDRLLARLEAIPQ